MERMVRPTLEEASGLQAGTDFGLCFNPEFLREGSSIKDFYDPPYTIIGGNSVNHGNALEAIYSGLSAPIEWTTYEVAETVKYVCNVFHALKVTFAPIFFASSSFSSSTSTAIIFAPNALAIMIADKPIPPQP